MNEQEFNFLEGKGIPYRHVYHLLYGTKKSNDQYFHDENLEGQGWGSSDKEIQKINEMESQLGDLQTEILDLRTMVDCCCIWRYDYPARVHLICSRSGLERVEIKRKYHLKVVKRRKILSLKSLTCWGKRKN